MKLAFIEIAGFRGFKDKARFDLPGGFVVLTGRNGVGKSTVLDAVDFLLTGTINKYSAKGAKGHGLEDHFWWVGEGVPEGQYVAVGFVNGQGEEFLVTRSRERGLDTPLDDLGRQICLGDSTASTWPEALMQTTLIRDETIAGLSMDLPGHGRFAAVRDAIGSLTGPDHSKRTGAILEAASSAKSAQDRRLADAQAELGRSLSALTEARSVAERQADVAEAEQIIESLAPGLEGAAGERVEVLRRHIADRKQSNSALAEALFRAEALQAERLSFESAAALAEIAAARADHAAALQAKERADEVLAGARQLQATERENDAFASRMLALLENGEALGLQAGHCPLCDARRTAGEFAAAIAAARNKLSARGAGAARAGAAVEQARLMVEQADTALTAAEQRVDRLGGRRNTLANETARVAATLAQLHIAASPSDPENVRRLLLQSQEETAQLEHALFILEASSAHGRVAALEGRVERLRLSSPLHSVSARLHQVGFYLIKPFILRHPDAPSSTRHREELARRFGRPL